MPQKIQPTTPFRSWDMARNKLQLRIFLIFAYCLILPQITERSKIWDTLRDLRLFIQQSKKDSPATHTVEWGDFEHF